MRSQTWRPLFHAPPLPRVPLRSAALPSRRSTTVAAASTPATYHKVTFRGQEILVAHNTPLRIALLEHADAGMSPHNGGAMLINCRGLGTCGTCAVRLRPAEGAHPPTAGVRERTRLALPPHAGKDEGLRLACRVRVVGDLAVEKLAGFWGQGPGEQQA